MSLWWGHLLSFPLPSGLTRFLLQDMESPLVYLLLLYPVLEVACCCQALSRVTEQSLKPKFWFLLTLYWVSKISLKMFSGHSALVLQRR